jgi:hypothetical protein
MMRVVQGSEMMRVVEGGECSKYSEYSLLTAHS